MYNFTAQKNPGLKTAFLKTLYLNRNNFHPVPYIEWDNEWYSLVDGDKANVQLLLQRKNSVKVVVSFQTYNSGKRVAVCRIHKDVETTTNQPMAFRG